MEHGKEGTNTVLKSRINVKKPSMYKVVMHNDDYTTMDFVVSVLTTIFNKEIKDAINIMMEIHKKGKGIAGIYTLDVAKTKISAVHNLAHQEGFPLKLTFEKV